MTFRSNEPCPYCGQLTIDGACTRHGAVVYGKGERHEQDRLFLAPRTMKGQTTMEGLR